MPYRRRYEPPGDRGSLPRALAHLGAVLVTLYVAGTVLASIRGGP